MSKVHQWTIGHSVNGASIEAWQFGNTGEVIHFYGGFHGDEPEGVEIVFHLKEYLLHHAKLSKHKTIIVVPLVNPDGYKNQTRVNANKVDLNRNFPTKDWVSKASQQSSLVKYFPGHKAASEPETCAIIELIEKTKPTKIISFHSLIPHQLNYDGPAKELAYAMSRHNQYPVTENIGYPTPGSLGNFAGRERKIAVITYELPEKIDLKTAWKEAQEALKEVIFFSLTSVNK